MSTLRNQSPGTAPDTAPDSSDQGRQRPGRLYLAPTPLGSEDDPRRVLPQATLDVLTGIDYVIAENARTARAVLGKLSLAHPLQAIEMHELNRRTDANALPALLAPVLAGRDAILMSEAGCPAVADPGAALVELAHRRSIQVIPLIGPSSILLALMASGMNGQRFAFAGYVPVPDDERSRRLRELEQRSAREDETQLLIETPYRNQALFDALVRQLQPTTMLAVASDISLPGESILSRPVGDWRRQSVTLPRVPTVFAFQAARSGQRPAPTGRPQRKKR